MGMDICYSPFFNIHQPDMRSHFGVIRIRLGSGNHKNGHTERFDLGIILLRRLDDFIVPWDEEG